MSVMLSTAAYNAVSGSNTIVNTNVYMYILLVQKGVKVNVSLVCGGQINRSGGDLLCCFLKKSPFSVSYYS